MPTDDATAASSQRRVRLLLTRTQKDFAAGPRFWTFPVVGLRWKSYWCIGCGATIEKGAPHGRDDNNARVCESCIEDAVDAQVVRERDAADTGERLTVEQLAKSVGIEVERG